jgi:nitric oxide synthase-interacting protein
MGKGQRHSKNAGIMGSEALTYHERKALGFGTVKERLGKVPNRGSRLQGLGICQAAARQGCMNSMRYLG